MSTMSALADLAAELALPDTPQDLDDIMKHLPRFAEQMNLKMQALSEWMKEQNILQDVAGSVESISFSMSSAEDAANEAYEAYTELYGFFSRNT